MRVLLVDHDSEGLETISRAIRGVLELDCVTSKGDAMLLLRQNTYDVLVACERCVDGSGLDLLGRTTRTAVPLKRIFAAPTDRLQLLGPRLAPFKVQRTINYPIDLEELWLAIAQVTGTNDETDGTVERVVLDERGIPAVGSVPRSPIPPRPPAPLREVRPAAPAVAAPAAMPVSATPAQSPGRATAAARVPQPVVDPPLRAPPRREAPPAPAVSDTGRMRALKVPPPPVRVEAAWSPEPAEDEFTQISEQARLGVQRKAAEEAARRKRQRLVTACAIASVVAGVIVFLIEKFHDPARAREKAIAAEVSRMAEQQKLTDNLTLIEVDIEKAIMENDLDQARAELARLVSQAPEHPRREFLQASIDRAAELARLAEQRSARIPARDAAGSAVPEAEPPVERAPERVPERAPARTAPPTRERVAAARSPEPASRPARNTANTARSFGAPIGESVGQRTIPLNAPINAEPVLAPARGNSFTGRTVEASDTSGANSAAPAAAAATLATVPATQPATGTAVVSPAPVAAPAAAGVDVTPARILKRVAPVPPISIAARPGGFVVVKYTVAANGRVTNVQVVESTPPGVFDGAALAAVRKWTYEPRTENGTAVPFDTRARLVFEPVN